SGPERTALHRAAAQGLERQHDRGGGQDLAALGDHWKGAGEPARAQPWYLAAARRAVSVYDHVQAERLYRASLELMPELSSQTVAVRIELASRVLSLRGLTEEALAQCHAAVEAAEQIGDLSGQGT